MRPSVGPTGSWSYFPWQYISRFVYYGSKNKRERRTHCSGGGGFSDDVGGHGHGRGVSARPSSPPPLSSSTSDRSALIPLGFSSQSVCPSVSLLVHPAFAFIWPSISLQDRRSTLIRSIDRPFTLSLRAVPNARHKLPCYTWLLVAFIIVGTRRLLVSRLPPSVLHPFMRQSL